MKLPVFLTFLVLLKVSGVKAQKNKYDFSLLDKKIQGWVDSGYYNGTSVIVAHDNRIVHEKYYGSYQPETVAYIASAGKWLAAAAIAAVVDEGKLSWDDKVNKWLPEFADSKGEATLRQLFSHTAGYPDYQPKGERPDNYQSLEESVKHIVRLPADTVPGTKFKYGGLAMQVAGRMAELATGRKWDELFHEKIAKPLEMRHTAFTPVDETPGHNPMLGGGARTSLKDYFNFLQMFANNGVFKGKKVLSRRAINEISSNQVLDAKINAKEFPEAVRASYHHGIYGLGMWLEETDQAGNALLLSSPSWAGAYPWIDRTTNSYGFLLARIKENKNGFNAFYASPVLPYLVRDILGKSGRKNVKTGYVEVEKDTRLYYEISGKGEPLILLHGHSFDHQMWDPQIEALASKYQVIRYDLRGYGRSAMPKEGKEFLHAEDLRKLMDALKIKKAHIVGLSLGGFVGTDFVALYQDRILSATMASGDIFEVPGPDEPWTAASLAKRRLEIKQYQKEGIFQNKKKWYNALTTRNGEPLYAIRKPVWEAIYKWDAWQPLHVEPRLVLGRNVKEKLRNIDVQVPVMVLTGDADLNLKNKLLALIPTARQVIIKNAGHMSNLENPEGFNQALLRFLSDK
ncbi:class A beta-lactamase-related serine hydrolase [Desertivirga xinjiangensis]|uniref:class A beta-lactamase-related serine hydrolase n=1 Tax=Desertivirga xinjiangensis TaxID=539206 RepID=UPI00210DBF30|nr:class A beta-lactamase-related serine hydrolase [Pedobacter xinjiangensis]